MCELMSCRASDIVLDDRPDAVLRYAIDESVARFWGWFKARMNETRKDGKEIKPKYRAEDLLRDIEDLDSPEDSCLWLPQSHRNKRTVSAHDLLRGHESSGRVLSPEEAY